MMDRGANAWEPADLLLRSRAKDASTAWSALHTVLASTGFEQSFYAFGVPLDSSNAVSDKLKSGIFGGGFFVNDFLCELGRRPAMLAVEPVSPHCRQSLDPFVWSCAELKTRARGPMAFARDFGIRSFMVFPLRDGDGSRYGNFTVFCDDDRHRSWLRHAQEFAPLLHVTAQYFHDVLSGFPDTARGIEPITLSPRQGECLLWASRGLSTKTIAARLSLSEPVVNEHLRAAKRKLGCVTRTHTVARAISLGLIKP